jgi:hypothetical protein
MGFANPIAGLLFHLVRALFSRVFVISTHPSTTLTLRWSVIRPNNVVSCALSRSPESGYEGWPRPEHDAAVTPNAVTSSTSTTIPSRQTPTRAQ